jgi:dCTP deaminase
MILTKDEILKAINSKRLKITPFSKSQIGAGSIDLTLGNDFRKFTPKREIITVSEDVDYKRYTTKFKARSIVLNPRELILGITKEKITMPDNLCGFLQGRTRFARIGLNVHITASFVQPGSSNRQVLEIVNLGEKPIKLLAGTKIVQLVVEKTAGKAKFSGKYNNQVL